MGLGCAIYFTTSLGPSLFAVVIGMIMILGAGRDYVKGNRDQFKSKIREQIEVKNNLLSEFINNIKMLKLSGWELIFKNKIT
jgi:ABC-type multidrug transport system fused ATPase/permease subunit